MEIKTNKPNFFRWALFRWNSFFLGIFALIYSYSSASYSFVGFGGQLITGFAFMAFMITLASFVVGYLIAFGIIYYFKFVSNDEW